MTYRSAKLLLEWGADPDSRYIDTSTPLIWAEKTCANGLYDDYDYADEWREPRQVSLRETHAGRDFSSLCWIKMLAHIPWIRVDGLCSHGLRRPNLSNEPDFCLRREQAKT